ncbi:MAG: hypothetical protein EBZ60_07660, partial [Betaproteobacteria bacterium]|nr:hypothetical protein [Betaproteobacteria bacterium]
MSMASAGLCRMTESAASRLITEHPEFYKLYAEREYTFNKIRQPNRNRLLGLDPSVDGMK